MEEYVYEKKNDTEERSSGRERESSSRKKIQKKKRETEKREIKKIFFFRKKEWDIGRGEEYVCEKKNDTEERSSEERVSFSRKKREKDRERKKSDLPVLDGVGKLENTSLYLSLISDVDLLVVSSNHGGLDLGSSNDGRENGSRSIISTESCLYHTGSVVNNESSFFVFFSHFEF